jgi:hypothetical protein
MISQLNHIVTPLKLVRKVYEQRANKSSLPHPFSLEKIQHNKLNHIFIEKMGVKYSH